MFTALEGDDTVRGITIQIYVCAQLLKHISIYGEFT